MFYMMLSIILIFLVSVFTLIGFVILGERLSNKYKGGRFAKWWNRYVVTKMPNNYED